MPIETNEEYRNFFIKSALYITGIVLGLVAKLAVISKEKPLTVKAFILHSSVAFACAWLVWSILSYYGRLDLANILSVIVGRFGDYVLFAIYKALRDSFINTKKL